MTRPVFLGIGSNIEPRLVYLQKAVGEIKRLGIVERISPLYRTAPYGVTNQADFLNCALRMKTELPAVELLRSLKKIETRLGRKERRRWGPREIDIDIIFYDVQKIETPGLKIPHPDYRNRVFVLRPLADISPEFIPPDETKSLKELVFEKVKANGCKLLATEWIDDGVKF